LAFVERSAAAYLRQTYAPRELLVVLDAGPEDDKARLESRLASLGRDDIRVIRAPGTPTLGRLRNIGIEQARGDLVCVWDDDDIHHPERLESQVRVLQESGAIATFLTDILHLFMGSRQLYWTTYKRAVQPCVAGTGLYLRSVSARYPEEGPDSQRGEDTAFCLRLIAEGPVRFIDNAPHLYIYVNHGSNTTGDAFHHMVGRSLSLSRGRIERAQLRLCQALDTADHGLDEVTVMTGSGPVFTWRREAVRAEEARQ
jgi:glycosyltransferase involved in cell wall biosynthesis